MTPEGGHRRVDGPLKVTGGAEYVGDLLPPGCLHAALVGSPVARGSVRAIDARAAEAAPGVRLVLTHGNASRLHPAPVLLGEGGREASAAESFLPLQDATIHHAGQPLALVVADTAERAAHAAGLVRLDLDATPPVADLDDPRAEPFAPLDSWADKADGGRGDFGAGWEAGAVRLDESYATALQHHVAMEPHATLAEWDGERVTVHEPTTWVAGARKTVAAWFGLDPEQVRVVQRFVGGSFGCKGPLWPHVALTVMAARAAGRPVRLVLGRRETFSAVGHRPLVRHRLRLAAGPDGRLTALVHDALTHSSMFDGRVVAPVTKTTRRMYACPNVSTTYRMVRLNLPGPFTMRGPGESPGLFALECAMDELAQRTGLDPIELRLRNHADTDPEHGQPWSSKHLRECYAAGAERFGWHRRPPAPRSMREGRTLVGWGMASMAYDAQAGKTAARAALSADDGLVVGSATCDQGTGSYTAYRALAAETLGWPFARTRFELGDSDLPTAPISAGSMTAASVGSAVQAAVGKLRRDLVVLACADAASPLCDADPEEVAVADGVLRARDGRHEDAAALLGRHGGSLAAEAEIEPAGFGRDTTHYSFGAHFAEVRVDEDLGTVRVSRHVGAFAAGRILQPRLAHSQLLGGIVWGIGMALLEGSELDARLGRVSNATLAEYLVPVCADIGAIDAFFLPEHDDRVNPLGVKGVGEIGTVGAAAAVANAVWHATGKRVRELPITPDRLLTL